MILSINYHPDVHLGLDEHVRARSDFITSHQSHDGRVICEYLAADGVGKEILLDIAKFVSGVNKPLTAKYDNGVLVDTGEYSTIIFVNDDVLFLPESLLPEDAEMVKRLCHKYPPEVGKVTYRFDNKRLRRFLAGLDVKQDREFRNMSRKVES